MENDMGSDSVDSEKKLRHIAIIMDGNGRWAQRHGVARIEGHKAGEKTVRRVMDLAEEFDVKYLTLYAFSTENWKRSEDEVSGLMTLLATSMKNNLDEMHRKGVRIRLSGRIEGLPLFTRKVLHYAVKKTRNNTRGNLILALNYGGRSEIVDAAQGIAKDIKSGKISPDDINEELFASYLYLPDVPDPDLLIRTSGECRLSNFLNWEIAYSEFLFTETLWPDFGRDDFEQAIDIFYKRERRFGGRKC